MKKIWCMLLMICSVCAFSACSDDDDKQKDIAGGDKECPVTEIKVPDSAETGETVTITGKGFVTTAKLTLQNENKENLELDATFTTTEGTFTIPVNFEAGKYKVVLTQAGEKWVIGSIEIIVLKRELRVKQIVTNNGSSVVTYNFAYDKENRITSITQVYDHAPEEPMKFDIAYETDRINITGFDVFSYDLEDGRVINMNIPEDEEEVYDYAWNYDENGYLTDGGYYEFPYLYEGKNLTAMDDYAMPFKYENPDLKNNLYLVDPVVIMQDLFTMILAGDYFDMLPHLLGICGNRSENLPTQIPDWDGDYHTLTYTYDSEHKDYISEVKAEYMYYDEITIQTLKIIYE